VKVLVENKANLDLVNRMHNTALHCAASNNEQEIVEILLDNKADIMLKNSVWI
jgi:ankyrin repeat protein